VEAFKEFNHFQTQQFTIRSNLRDFKMVKNIGQAWKPAVCFVIDF